MELLESIITEISNQLWGYPMIILLVGTHLYFTILLKFPQRKILTGIRLSMSSEKGAKGDISAFGALTTALAATIGTGNIIGVATAVALGGPGAVFWCWITGVLGMSSKYAEGLLAVKYRQVTADGSMIGGPMYALEKGLGMRWLAILFCIFTAIAAFGIGNTVQSNSLALLLSHNFAIPTHWTGIVLVILVAMVTVFGIKGIAKVCSFLIPIMAVGYIGGCLYILVVNHAVLIEAILLIAKAAFSPQAAGAGFLGGSVMMAARYGVARGIFSNESGMGSAPIIAAAAKTKNPVRQALVSASGTFWDTVVICALTGLVIVSTIIAHPEISQADGAVLTWMAFEKIPFIGTWTLTFGLMTFSFSTILGWSYYGEKAIDYLGGKRYVVYYRICWLIAVYVGSVFSINLIWSIADVMNALMAIPNLIALLLLSSVVAKDTNKYLWGNKLHDDDIDDEQDH